MKPPRWADRFLEWYCNPELREDLQGDLHERFNVRVNERGGFYARVLFVIDVISFIQPYTLRRSNRSGNSMLHNMIIPNLRFSVRYLTRHKFFTGLHIFGLTLGISVNIVIFLFIRYELSFDTWSDDSSRTYRVNSSWQESNQRFSMYATPIPLADLLRNDISGMEKVVRVLPQFKSTVAITPEKVFSQEHIMIADPGFIDIFDVKLISGDKKALSRPYEALISETTARKFFGDEDPSGKSFRYRSKFDIRISGVFRDLPGNTSMPASILLSYVDDETFTSNGDTWYFGGAEWTTLNAITYVVLGPAVDTSLIQSQLDVIAATYINKTKEAGDILGSLSLQPISDVHLDAERFGGGPWVKATDPKWIFLFATIGIAVLFLACVNFVNLSTAQAIVRTREAGIRKSIGAGRRELIFQFLIEPMMLVFISGVLAVVLTGLFTTTINQLLERQIDFSVLTTPVPVTVIVTGLLLTALAAGSYPAWLIARTNTVTSLKSGFQNSGTTTISWLRKTLIVFQFVVSAVLMTTVFAIAQQIRFIQNRDLGFQSEGVVTVGLPDPAKMQSFITRVRSISGVVDAALSRTPPLSNDHWWNTMGINADNEKETVCVVVGDEQYFKVYNLKLISGRIPTPSPADSVIHQVIVNERFLRQLDLGSPDEAIGKRFSWAGTAEITGVVADFNSEPLRYEIMPTMIYQDPEVYSQASIRFDPSANQSVLESIALLWKTDFPSEPYDARIVNDEIAGYYKAESTTFTLFLIFAGVAVLISCVGLLGLTVFSAVRRVKEISIRKILGASVENIVVLLSNQFLKVVGIACIVALPLAWFGIDFLLKSYAYRISLTWELLLLPMILLIVIAFVTMLSQTIKASTTDPVKNLRSE